MTPAGGVDPGGREEDNGDHEEERAAHPAARERRDMRLLAGVVLHDRDRDRDVRPRGVLLLRVVHTEGGRLRVRRCDRHGRTVSPSQPRESHNNATPTDDVVTSGASIGLPMDREHVETGTAFAFVERHFFFGYNVVEEEDIASTHRRSEERCVGTRRCI